MPRRPRRWQPSLAGPGQDSSPWPRTPQEGQPFLEAKEIYRSQAKSGTSHFHAYASAYVVVDGQRFTLILRNVWVWYHGEVLASPRRGRRWLRLERLRLETLLIWLLHVAEAALGIADETATERGKWHGLPAPERLRHFVAQVSFYCMGMRYFEREK